MKTPVHCGEPGLLLSADAVYNLLTTICQYAILEIRNSCVLIRLT